MNYKKKLFIILGVFAPLIIYIFLIFYTFILLNIVGEIISVEKVIVKQVNNSKCIYGTKTYENFKRYKILLNNYVKPSVIAIGSSRVMQFREELFNENLTFINLGGSVGHMNDYEVLQNLINFQNTEYVLIGIDPWIFNKAWSPKKSIKNDTFQFDNFDLDRSFFSNFKKNYSNENMPTEIANSKNEKFIMNEFNKVYANDWTNFSTNHFFRSIELLFNGKLHEAYRNKMNYYCSFGVGANFLDGFLTDGSRIQLNNFNIKKEKRFNEVKNRIINGTERFQHGEDFDKLSFEILLNFLSHLKSKNIKTIVFFSPYPKEINKLLDSKEFEYINRLKYSLYDKKIIFYDFMNEDKFHFNDCYFMDGDHPSTLTNAKMLKYISNEYTNLVSKNLDLITSKNIEYILETQNKLYKKNFFKNNIELNC